MRQRKRESALTKPKLSLRVSKSVDILCPVTVEIHGPIHSPLEYLYERKQ